MCCSKCCSHDFGFRGGEGSTNVIVMTLVLGMANGQPNVILMTLGLGVASEQPTCLCGGSVGCGPWAHGMALGPGPLRGPNKDREES